MTRVVRFHELGGPEVLRIDSVDVRAPKPDEVQIRVKALGLNRAEAMFRNGTYIEMPVLPAGLGYEAAGLIEQVGDAVEGLAPGNGVSIIPAISMIPWPTYGELINVPARLAVKHPAILSWEEAAALWMAYLTAYGALIDIAALRVGDFVAITAASSSVGLAAIQIAKMAGATPIAVTRTNEKVQALRNASASHVIATAEESLESRLKEIAGARGVRVVFDPIGGPIFTPLAAAMARGGILLQYGALSSEPTPFPLFAALSKSLTLRGYLVHELTGDPARLEAAKAFILKGVEKGALRPIIAKSFAFDEIVEAHRFLQGNTQFGKVVVTV
jgi:NADPH:quinone reductase-like Zn-dependent oxidoreductase